MTPPNRSASLPASLRRSGKPATRPQPEAARSYAEDTVYGTCENPDCDRHARATCATCGGEYCLRHEPHGQHDESTERR